MNNRNRSGEDWWPSDVPFPCLYVGKATNLKKRFGQHLMRGTPRRAHEPLAGNVKAKARMTACQLRAGIEHVFPTEANPLVLINDAVGYSWCDTFPDNAVAERLFAENRLVGHLRPWFNIALSNGIGANPAFLTGIARSMSIIDLLPCRLRAATRRTAGLVRRRWPSPLPSLAGG